MDIVVRLAGIGFVDASVHASASTGDEVRLLDFGRKRALRDHGVELTDFPITEGAA